MKTAPFFEQYTALIEKLDVRIDELQNSQIKHIHCKKGCAACCMNFGILPVEYYVISQAIAEQNIHVENDKQCKFLNNNVCTIYAHRPIICRTQGLANVYFNEETGMWELSLCEQNFTDISDDFFTEEQCLNMGEINEMLATINRDFLDANKETLSNLPALIDVNEL
ncbi:MAG: YkgJ family cysteine cluster protein [Bacteroidales bacterium]|jgi:Fe-S-cluster containining protein|nr:YkgJ family cysteine cluster protein [Bacteroidales bacterium]